MEVCILGNILAATKKKQYIMPYRMAGVILAGGIGGGGMTVIPF
jgi:hypothetical protein